MDTFTTLEEVRLGAESSLFADEQWELRPEQRDAIDFAKDQFCKRSGTKGSYVWTMRPEYKQFLWNAKMRFGKTMCALQLAREMGVKRTLIVTHRPVVSQGWKDDFENVFSDKIKGNTNVKSKYSFGELYDDEQHDKRKFYDLEKFVQTEGNHYVFFVSMQYLRLSELVNAKTQAKNEGKQNDVDLWGHNATKENEKLKADILNTDWDLIVIDEAHEGTRTSLGKKVIDEFLHKKSTKMLHLSGTPFNLYEDFGKDEIFNWDYIAEQSAKAKFYEQHPGEKNPYEELPRLNIATFDIRNIINNYLDQEGLFTFNEFFRTWTGNPRADLATMPDGAKGRFVHEDDVKKFLDLLCTKDDSNNFPFSTVEYRKSFRHTLWVVSHVDEARALEQLLNEHKTFGRFTIVNVAGKSEEDEQREDALDKVKRAIGDLPESTSTITISCGRLTTGVTIRPWSAVLYLKGGNNPATYMQTIFRVQTPYITKDGAIVKQISDGCKIKRDCYVFDFAPDRAGKMVAGTAKFTSMAKSKESKKKVDDEEDDLTQDERDKQTLSNFIKFCPMFSLEGAMMTPISVDTIFKQLNNAFIDRLVRKGFDDPCLYNQDELNKLNPEILNHIGENGGQAPDEKRQEAKKMVDLSNMTEEQRKAWEENIRRKKAEAAEKAKKKAEKDEEFKKKWESWTEEQKDEWLQQEAEKAAKREKAKEEREEFKKRMTNIRGISLRIPLLMYGGADAGEADDDITVDNFTRKIKDESWEEFMPKGITKEDFNKIKKVFNATRFFEAGKRYRQMTKEADRMHVDERIQQIAEIFSYFRNPDKETVLTPWRVVNMHMSDTIGGYCFYDESFDEKTGMLEHPRLVDRGDVTKQLFDNVDLAGEVQTKILEINSKTGLYPLYVTYSLYRRRMEEYIKAECIDPATISVQEEQVVWGDIIKDNVFVICNTPMAVGITRRTLFGFREMEQKANIKAIKLIERATEDQKSLIADLKSVGFWKGNTSKKEMVFNAVIGNPPYQVTGDGNNRSLPIYHLFVDMAKVITGKYTSLIMPARWYTPSILQGDFTHRMLEDKTISKLVDFSNAVDCFPSVEIKGGICYFLADKTHDDPCVVESHHGKNVFKSYRYLKSEGVEDAFVRFSEGLSIIEKVRSKNLRSFADIVSSQNPFGYNSKVVGSEEKSNGDVIILSKFRTVGYINYDAIPLRKEYVNQWKVMTPIAGEGGTLPHRVTGRPFVSEPGECCNGTYMVIGPFVSKEIAENAVKYLNTKFLRFMVSTVQITQNTKSDSYRMVPQVDLTSNSIINWDSSIEEIDSQLYSYFELEIFEREFIESMIKPME